MVYFNPKLGVESWGEMGGQRVGERGVKDLENGVILTLKPLKAEGLCKKGGGRLTPDPPPADAHVIFMLPVSLFILTSAPYSLVSKKVLSLLAD